MKHISIEVVNVAESRSLSPGDEGWKLASGLLNLLLRTSVKLGSFIPFSTFGDTTA